VKNSEHNSVTCLGYQLAVVGYWASIIHIQKSFLFCLYKQGYLELRPCHNIDVCDLRRFPLIIRKFYKKSSIEINVPLNGYSHEILIFFF
jgi:hypothetical protein